VPFNPPNNFTFMGFAESDAAKPRSSSKFRAGTSILRDAREPSGIAMGLPAALYRLLLRHASACGSVRGIWDLRAQGWGLEREQGEDKNTVYRVIADRS